MRTLEDKRRFVARVLEVSFLGASVMVGVVSLFGLAGSGLVSGRVEVPVEGRSEPIRLILLADKVAGCSILSHIIAKHAINRVKSAMKNRFKVSIR